MKKLLYLIQAMMMVLVLCSLPALGSGFSINEQGARAMAQAMAFVARADDASAVFYNPAAITQLEGTHLYSGMTMIGQSSNWMDGDLGLDIDSDDKMVFPPHFYLTHQFSDNWFMGLGVFVPFGLGKEWPDDFPGKYNSKMAVLEVFYLNPNIAFKVSDKVSLAVGVDILKAKAKLDRVLPLFFIIPGVPDGYFSAEVDDIKVGWNAAMHVKLTENVFLGVSYRAGTKLDMEGDLTITLPHTGDPVVDGTLAALFPSQPVRAEISLPGVLSFGVGGNVTDRFETEVDIQWTNWSVYENLPFYFSEQTAALQDSENPKDWTNAWTIRWGNEFHYNESFDIRAGMYYDTTPIPDETLDPLLPGNNRFSFQVGFGWHNEKMTFDFAYMYLNIFERDISPNLDVGIIPNTGTYNGSGHLFGISLGYKF